MSFDSSRGRVNINRFNMHPLDLSMLPAAVNHSLRERKRSLAEWMAAVRVHSAQEPILDENPHKAMSFLFLCTTFPFDILKAISSAMHTNALHNRTWNAAFQTLYGDKRQDACIEGCTEYYKMEIQ